jgi:hypothetical protein
MTHWQTGVRASIDPEELTKATDALPTDGWEGPVTEVGAGVPDGKTGSVQLLAATLTIGAAVAVVGVTKTIMEPHDKSRGPIIRLVRQALCIGSPRCSRQCAASI